MRKLLMVLLLLLLSGSLTATGTVVMTTTLERMDSRSFVKHALVWTSHTDGTVGSNAQVVGQGLLRMIEASPGSVATQPTNLYDLQVKTPTGVDILTFNDVSMGANLSNTTPKVFLLDPPVVIDSTTTLDLVITNAGSGKTGTVTFWIER